MLNPVLPLAFQDRDIIGAHIPSFHKTLFIEFPVFIAMGPKPLARIGIAPFVFKAKGNTVIRICPKFFHEPVSQSFARNTIVVARPSIPFPCQARSMSH